MPNRKINKKNIWENSKLLSSIDLKDIKDTSSTNILPLNQSELNDLNGSKWTLHGKSVQTFNSPITKKRKLHGAAFPISLAKHFIEIYSKPGDIVLDPFAGVGTTLDAANMLKRHAIGVELSHVFIELFNQGIDKKDGKENNDFRRIMIQDSALNLEQYFQDEYIDLIITSPPYSNLLNNIRKNFADKDYKGNPYKNQSRKLAKPYSKHNLDLGNIPYKDYLVKIEVLFNSLYDIAIPGAYNVWVVRDFRSIPSRVPYVNLHSDITTIANKTNWITWDLVIWDQSNQRKLVRLGGNKSRRFYFNIGHSFILIFRKNMKNEDFK